MSAYLIALVVASAILVGVAWWAIGTFADAVRAYDDMDDSLKRR